MSEEIDKHMYMQLLMRCCCVVFARVHSFRSLRKYEILQRLGKGAYGYVWKVNLLHIAVAGCRRKAFALARRLLHFLIACIVL